MPCQPCSSKRISMPAEHARGTAQRCWQGCSSRAATPAAGQPGPEGKPGESSACSHPSQLSWVQRSNHDVNSARRWAKQFCNFSRTWISEGFLWHCLTLLAQMHISVLAVTEYGTPMDISNTKQLTKFTGQLAILHPETKFTAYSCVQSLDLLA